MNIPNSNEIHWDQGDCVPHVTYRFTGKETGEHEYTGKSFEDCLSQFRFDMELHDLNVVLSPIGGYAELQHPTAGDAIFVDRLEIGQI